MGARESAARNSEAQEASIPDYYELLSIEESATTDDIKARSTLQLTRKCLNAIAESVQETRPHPSPR